MADLYSVTDFGSDYRYIISGNYRVIYRYKHDTISIIRVLYGKRDFMKIIFG